MEKVKIENQKLTEHFYAREFFPNIIYRERLNSDGGVSREIFDNLLRLSNVMEDVRGLISRPIQITSGFRIPEQNTIAGGVLSSRHLSGLACDWFASGILASQVFLILQDNIRLLRSLDISEVIFYPKKGIVHLALNRDGEHKFIIKKSY